MTLDKYVYRTIYEYETQYKMFNWEAKYVRDMSEDGWELVTIISGDLYAYTDGPASPKRQYQWVWKRLKAIGV